jgi:branched-chain amino acid transport system substrate-binding protein
MRFFNYLGTLFFRRSNLPSVIPAQAGIHRCYKALEQADGWIPSFDGMTIKVRGIIVFLMLFFLFITPVQADSHKDPIKVGGIFSYSDIPSYMIPAQHAAQMAVEEVNAQGGIKGRDVEILLRDDRGNPADGVSAAQILVEKDKVVALFGQSGTGIALAISDYANRQKIPYFAAWCWKDRCEKSEKNQYTLTLDLSPEDTLKPLAEYAASLDVKRWVFIGPSIEYGQTVKSTFEKQLKDLNPNASVVANIRSDNGNFLTILRTARANRAEGIITSIYGSQFVDYIRIAQKLGIVDLPHISSYFPPEEMRIVGDELPKEWFVLGYPESELNTSANLSFIKKFEEKYDMKPGISGLITYTTTKFLLQALENASDFSSESIVAAAGGSSVETPAGLVTLNPNTHRADLGYWYGFTDLKKDKTPILRDFFRTGEKPQ